MTRQKTLQCMFKSINREEIHVHMEREFENLGNRLGLENTMEKNVVEDPRRNYK